MYTRVVRGAVTAAMVAAAVAGGLAVPGRVPFSAGTVMAQSAPAEAKLSGPAQLELDQEGTFEITGIDEFERVSWSFGDGIYLTGGLTAVHSFSSTGSYTVTARIIDAAGIEHTRSVSVSVVDNNPGTEAVSLE